MLDFKQMMEQAQQMQFKMQELQEKFKDLEVESESGGGLVKVVMSCTGVVKSIDIEPSMLEPSEKETLEDLLIAAMNNANNAREDRVQQESNKMMSEAGINPDKLGGGLPF